MALLKKICIAVFVYSLVACSDSDPSGTDTAVQDHQETVQQEKETSTGRASPHTIQGMKKVMDDARGVEDLLQKRHEEQRKEIDNL